MENLDTDLPLPPEAVSVTAENLAEPRSNSWLPFTGDLDLRAAISDFLTARTGHHFDAEREIVVTSGGMEGLLDVVLAVVDPGDELIVTDPTYAGIVNRVHLAGGSPALRAVPPGGRRVAARSRRADHRDRPEDPGDAADEPVDAVRRLVRRARLAVDLRPLAASTSSG